MKKVFIISPFASPTAKGLLANLALARELCLYVVNHGGSPFAPHLHYPAILDDSIPKERAKGLELGHAWMKHADYVLCWDDCEPSEGMKMDLERARKLKLSIFYVGRHESGELRISTF